MINWRHIIKFNVIVSILRLGRLHFIFLGFFLYLFGSGLALISGAMFEITHFILGYLIVFLAQLSVSYGNDYFDVEADRFTTKTLFSGGSKVLIEHPELRILSKWFAISLMFMSVLLASVCTILFSLPFLFLVFVIVGNILSWSYSAPPLRLVYRGFGELTVMLTTGVFLPGLAYWINKGVVDNLYFLFVFPLLLYGLGMILNLEMPDKEADSQADKKTFINRRGIQLGFLIIWAVFFYASLYFFILYVFVRQIFGLDFRIITFFSLLPLGLGFYGVIKRKEEQNAKQLAMANLISILLLIIICDLYFVHLLLF